MRQRKPSSIVFYIFSKPYMDEATNADEGVDLNIDEHLETLDEEQLREFAKQKALEVQKKEQELHSLRSNTEKWVKKLLDEKKELEKGKDEVTDLVKKEIAQQAVKSEIARTVAQLPEWVREKFNEKFTAITKWVDLTIDDVNSYLSDALKLVDVSREAIPVMGGSFIWPKPADKTDKRTPEQRERTRQFLEKGA